MPPLPIGYLKHQWRNKLTSAPYGPVNETRLGEMEQGIEDAHTSLDWIVHGGSLTAIGGVVKAGTISDADFASPADGDIGVNTNENQLVYRSGGQWYGLPAPVVNDFVVVTTGATAYGLNRKGAIVFKDSSGDSGAVLHSILNTSESAGTPGLKSASGNACGTVGFGPQTHTWKTTASIPRVAQGTTPDTRRLTIDLGDTKHVYGGSLTTTMIDYGRVADHDIFANFTLQNGLIDGTGMTGVRYAIGSNKQRGNFQDIEFHRLRFINMPLTPASSIFSGGILVSTSHLAVGEGTQSVVKNVTATDIEMDGGATMVAVVAAGGTTNGLNVLMDKIHIDRWRHDMGGPSAVSGGGAHVQVGSKAQCGTVYVGHGYGRGSLDVGIELDCVQDGTVEDVTIDDAYASSFELTTFNAFLYPDTAKTTYINCRARKLAQTVVNWRAFEIRPSFTNSICQASLIGCRAEKRTADANTQGWALSVPAVAGSPGFDTITLSDFTAIEEGIATTTGTQVSMPIQINQVTGTGKLFANQLKFRVRGDATGATQYWTGIDLGVGSIYFEINGVHVDHQLTNQVGGRSAVIEVCRDGTGTMYGKIDGIVVDPGFVSNANSCGVRVYGTGQLTIPAKKFISVDRCDLAAVTAGKEIELVATAQTAVFTKRIVYNTANGQPAPVAFTPGATGVGKALGVTWDAFIQIVQGTGTGITAVDVSTNGGTNYTNTLTQAAAAMPAGTDQWIGPVRGDSLLKWTGTTAPTVNLVPANT